MIAARIVALELKYWNTLGRERPAAAPTAAGVTAPTPPEPVLNPKRGKAMPISALAASIIIMDATIVTVALPVLI